MLWKKLIFEFFLDENLDKISQKIIAGLDRVEGNFIGKGIEFIRNGFKF